MVTGILWLLLGFMILSYRPSSISIAVVFMAIVFGMGALSCFAIAAATLGGWRVLALVGGVLATLAAIGVLVWPSPTLLIISIYVAWYLLIRGIFDVVIALSNTSVRGWWLTLLAGIAADRPRRLGDRQPGPVGAAPAHHHRALRRVPRTAELVAGLHYRQMRRELAAA